MIEYLVAAASLLLTMTCLAFIIRRIREDRQLTRLEVLGAIDKDVLVSIIVPARNEEESISSCIEGVLSQEGLKKEVIVVDDASEDDTPMIIIRNYLCRGVKLVRISGPEEGWVGKSWACHQGYLESSGDWLLFIDADTTFKDKYVVRDSVNYAIRNGADALSLIPMLDASTFASRVMLPTLLALKYVLAPPRRSNDPSDKLAFFYGSYMLFRRSVYEAVGGHARVRSRILEDKNLGESVKSAGYRVALLDARQRLRAKFNEVISDYVNALLRLFTEYAESAGARRLWKYLAAGLVFLLLPIVLAFYPFLTHASTLSALLSVTPLLLIFVIQATELRRLGAPAYYFPLVVFSVLMILAVLFYVAVSYRFWGVRIRWRGREYRYVGARQYQSHRSRGQ